MWHDRVFVHRLPRLWETLHGPGDGPVRLPRQVVAPLLPLPGPGAVLRALVDGWSGVIEPAAWAVMESHDNLKPVR
jgi:hypothetical protein